MRPTCLTLLLLLLFQQGFSQTTGITYKGKGVSLATVFAIIEKQTDYTFHYKVEVLEKARKVDVDFIKEPLSDVLKVLFANQPLKFIIIEKNIAVSYLPAQQQPDLPVTGSPAEITVSGIVMNKGGERLGNASVTVKGTQKGTSTKADGTFVLEQLNPSDVLRISFIGYQTTERPARTQGKLMIVLEETKDQLDEVVAQGYSKTTRRLSTSTVNKVSGEEIARQPTMNPLLALQGKVPGMMLTPVSNYEASPIEIDIRGRSLLNGQPGKPLIVIDGNPMFVGTNRGSGIGDGPSLGFASGYSPAGSQSPLFGLNPRDIESIEILKDVGATAIYGSTGANGVILITTKRGKPGASQFDVNVSTGISRITKYWDMLSTPQYLEMRREAFRNDGIIPTVQNAPDLFLWDTTRQVDWQREFWGRTGKRYNITASLSGGTPQLTYRLTADYSKAQDITTASGSNQNFGVSLKMDHRSTNGKFSAGLSITYFNPFANMVMSPMVSKLPPHAPPILNEKGNVNWEPYNQAGLRNNVSTFSSLVTPPADSRSNTLSSALNLRYQLLKGLSLVTAVGYTRSDNTTLILGTIKSQNPIDNPTGTAIHGKSSSIGWNLEPQLNYSGRLFGKGQVQILAGGSIRQQRLDNISVVAGGYTDDALLKSIELTTPGNVMSRNTLSFYKYAGIFGGFSFSWDNKYVLDLRGRRDGSSRFGPGNRFGNFGSVGVGWIVSDEPWFKKALSPVVSFLKFNSNFGTSGQDAGSDYEYLSQWSRIGSITHYDGVPPLMIMIPVNQHYKWALTKEFNIGLDSRFLQHQKLGISINYYRRRVGNQLTNIPTPAFTGFPTFFGNWEAAIQNEGWEMTLSMGLGRKDFSWRGSINGGINKNKLVSYPGLESSPYARLYSIGGSITDQYLLTYMGVNPLTGLYQYVDYNKDGKINRSRNVLPPGSPESDSRSIVNTMPVIAGGMNHSFHYKNFSVNLSFDYAIQKGQPAYANLDLPGSLNNIPVEIFNNRWQKPGDNARFARFSSSNGGPAFNRVPGNSTNSYVDASFLRFRDISLSYQLPERFLQKCKVKNAGITIRTNNLFVITRYEGIDPEVRYFGGMPPQKIVNATLSLTL